MIAAAVLLIAIAGGTVAAVAGHISKMDVSAQTQEEGAETVTESIEQLGSAPTETPTPIVILVDKTEAETEQYGCALYGTYGYPYNTMSQDWGADQVEGFWYHDITEECVRSGGYAPVIIQVYTYIVCEQYGVDYEMVFALIEQESRWKWNVIGDDGASTGLMQIQGRWHQERMERLNSRDLLNPFQNINVGVDFLAELWEEYEGQDIPEDIRWYYVLAAYNMGQTGAQRNLFSQGKYEYRYNTEIMNRAAELKAEKAAGQQKED